MSRLDAHRDDCQDRECRTKIRYPTRRWARRGLKALARRQGLQVSTLSTYRCKWCGLWHVGNDWTKRKPRKTA
jgi:hypothetical protein